MEFSNEKDIEKARCLLIEITNFLDDHEIPYCLEGGTLLGIIRDGDLLPWDHDVDISIALEDANDFNKIKNKLIFKGYRVTSKISAIENGPIKKGDYRIFKVKPFWKSIFKMVVPAIEDKCIIFDIFVKSSDDSYTYWQSMGEILRVDKKHYDSTDEISFRKKMLKTPAESNEYLTQKYGDWSLPIKDWNCARDEKTIIK